MDIDRRDSVISGEEIDDISAISNSGKYIHKLTNQFIYYISTDLFLLIIYTQDKLLITMLTAAALIIKRTGLMV